MVDKKENKLIFVEVRTKRGDLFGMPEDTIDKKKLKKLCRNAQGYVNKINWQNPYRIDAVCIVLGCDNNMERLNHYENII